jgi:hypothetical protein
MYGIAFVIYAAAEIFRTRKTGTYSRRRCHEWLERYADCHNGGYFERLRRMVAIFRANSASRNKNLYSLDTLVGYKSEYPPSHSQAYTLLYESGRTKISETV